MAKSAKLLDLDSWFGADDPLNPDKLLPELRECYIEDGPIGPMIKHPLVNEIMFHSWKLANEMYEAKRKLIEERLAQQDYLGILALYERPWRLQAVHTWWQEDTITKDELRDLFSWVWTDCEMPSQFGDMPRELFRATGFLTDIEGKRTRRDVFGCQKEITVYRGCQPEHKNGLSWTRNAAQAAFFAKRFNTEGEVWSARAPVKSILGVFLGRGEDEAVVAPEKLKQRRREEREG